MVQKDTCSTGCGSLYLTAIETKDKGPKGEGLEKGCKHTGWVISVGVACLTPCLIPRIFCAPAVKPRLKSRWSTISI